MDLNTILEFSQHNCIGICAFLVPANLIATLQTLILVFLEKSPRYIRFSLILAALFAILQVLHVASWFVVGVVSPVTFILLSLSSFCLFLNVWTILNASTYQGWVKSMIAQLRKVSLELGVRS